MTVHRIAVGRVGPVERRPERAEGRRAPAHAERITVSPDALEATRELPDPVRGDVRWYRARQASAGVEALDPSRAGARVGDGAAPPGAEAAGDPARAHHPRAAIAAYLRNDGAAHRNVS